MQLHVDLVHPVWLRLPVRLVPNINSLVSWCVRAVLFLNSVIAVEFRECPTNSLSREENKPRYTVDRALRDR